MLTLEEVRVECLKLAHAHGKEPAQVVERARIYEQYVDFKAKPLGLPEKPGNSQKK